jgi:hypothetical protein
MDPNLNMNQRFVTIWHLGFRFNVWTWCQSWVLNYLKLTKYYCKYLNCNSLLIRHIPSFKCIDWITCKSSEFSKQKLSWMLVILLYFVVIFIWSAKMKNMDYISNLKSCLISWNKKIWDKIWDPCKNGNPSCSH